MPSARVSTATAVKPGFLSSWRKANLRSLITQSLHRIDSRRPSRRHPAGEQGHARKRQRDYGEGERIGGLDLEEQRLQHSRKGQRCHQTDTDTQQRKPHTCTNQQTKHVTSLRTQSHAHTYFASSLAY